MNWYAATALLSTSSSLIAHRSADGLGRRRGRGRVAGLVELGGAVHRVVVPAVVDGGHQAAVDDEAAGDQAGQDEPLQHDASPWRGVVAWGAVPASSIA